MDPWWYEYIESALVSLNAGDIQEAIDTLSDLIHDDIEEN